MAHVQVSCVKVVYLFDRLNLCYGFVISLKTSFKIVGMNFICANIFILRRVSIGSRGFVVSCDFIGSRGHDSFTKFRN